MKRFIYLITDRNRNTLHVGLCSDLLKTLKFYSEMPTLFFDSAQQLNRLVYFEEINKYNTDLVSVGKGSTKFDLERIELIKKMLSTKGKKQEGEF